MQTRRMCANVGNENAIEVAKLVGTGERERGTLVTRRPNISNTVVPSNIVIAVGARNSITWAGREGKGKEALRAECAHDVE